MKPAKPKSAPMLHTSRAPQGLRLYAVGDIHGCAAELAGMLELIRRDHGRINDGKQARLIFLGDYIDRGPDSRGVIETLLNLEMNGFETVFLKGNHEVLLERFLNGAEMDDYAYLFMNGGRETLRSYGLALERLKGVPGDDSMAAIRTAALACIPSTHRQFLASLALTARFGDYLFVHAGVRPRIPLDRQQEHDLLWIRDEFLDHTGDFGAVIVHGHTPQPAPVNLNNRIGIDTGAFFTGRLTAVALENGTRRFFEMRLDVEARA